MVDRYTHNIVESASASASNLHYDLLKTNDNLSKFRSFILMCIIFFGVALLFCGIALTIYNGILFKPTESLTILVEILQGNVDITAQGAGVIMIVIGAVLLVFSWIGCTRLIRYNRKMFEKRNERSNITEKNNTV
mgnify:CR=1 FL=1|jgi:hypothetical protein